MAVSSRLCWHTALLLATLTLCLFPIAPHVKAQASVDFPIANGHFYSEANGQGGGSGQPGFAVTDDSGIPFWSTFSRDGGVAAFGYPISTRFLISSATDQALQKGILQWDTGGVSVVNVLDVLHDAGLDAVLQSRYLTPPPADTSPDAGLEWAQIVARHQQFLAGNPAIRAAYFAAADPITLYGLPMSPPTLEANGNVVVVRLQRAVLQQWLSNQPWATAGQVTIANAGDIAKTAGLLPASSLTPQAPPAPSPTVPYSVTATTSDNWSGYVAAADPNGGQPGTISDVKASWTVPSVNCSSTPNAAVGVWVGIDGVFSPTVEQTGTASKCIGGQASYYAWLEIYPSAARTSAMAIQPGDVISAEVQFVGNLQYRLTLSDATSGRTFSVLRFSPGSRDSAEWVVEAPAVGDQIVPLANFGSVSLSGATATVNGVAGGVGNPTWTAAGISMLDGAGLVRAAPSSLSTDDSSFTVTWQRP
ncbi:MAG TPA: G1 family glutamic endopeptidase [Chloroflexota bacterium]